MPRRHETIYLHALHHGEIEASKHFNITVAEVKKQIKIRQLTNTKKNQVLRGYQGARWRDGRFKSETTETFELMKIARKIKDAQDELSRSEVNQALTAFPELLQEVMRYTQERQVKLMRRPEGWTPSLEGLVEP